MPAPSFVPLTGYDKELREWLGLGDDRHPKDPSLHDLLDLDESCRDPETIKANSIERANALRGLETSIQREGDPAVVNLLNRVTRYISSAERLLCDGKQAEKYWQELIEYRSEAYRKYLRLHCDPEAPLNDEARATLLQIAGEHRLPQASGEEILSEFFVKTPIPEKYRDLVKWLKIEVHPKDPNWPTHFDVLGIPDGQSATKAILEKEKSAQLAKIPPLDRHPDPQKKRKAEAVRQYVENAATQLSAQCPEYVEKCQRNRALKFEEMAKEHNRVHGELTAEGELRLLQEALSIRLSDEKANTTIVGVFGSTRRSPGSQSAGKPSPGPSRRQPARPTQATSVPTGGSRTPMIVAAIGIPAAAFCTFAVVLLLRSGETVRVVKVKESVTEYVKEPIPSLRLRVVGVSPDRPVEGGTLTVTVRADGSGAERVDYEYLYGSSWLPAENGRIIIRDLEPGRLDIEVRATSAGSSAELRKSYHVNGRPTVRRLSPDTSTIDEGGPFYITIHAYDPDEDPLTYEYRTAGRGQWEQDLNSTICVPHVHAGQFSIEVRVADSAGNRSEPMRKTWTAVPNPWEKWQAEVIQHHSRPLEAVAIAPHGGQYACGGHDGYVTYGRIGRSTRTSELAGSSGIVYSVAFGTDGQSLAGGGQTGLFAFGDCQMDVGNAKSELEGTFELWHLGRGSI